jgi:hypothetical protein
MAAFFVAAGGCFLPVETAVLHLHYPVNEPFALLTKRCRGF